MADPQCDTISAVVEENWLMQAENGVRRKDPSIKRRSFLSSLQIKLGGVRHEYGNTFSSQYGNAAACLLCSSLFRVVSTLVFFGDRW